ncbi:MAG: cell division protein FtsZ [Rikenella sp.]|nr:cell division protein FtsZ [Rikenella sp.]
MVLFVYLARGCWYIIRVWGVGGAGGNAVNHMFKLGIADVSFMVCNTDRQALGRSPIPTQVRLGETLTEGLGAGNRPERGRAAAEESIEEIKEIFREKHIRMVFVTAGMGGGTGTGAAPVIAKAAKEMGILTVAIVTIPFKTEGPRRIMQALEGIEEIRHNVDSLLVVNNENINEIYGDLTLSEAFGKADDILASAAKSIADIITQENHINVDFADVQTVMRDSGIALMGSACGSGENRALEVAEAAMNSPLLNHRDIAGAKNVLLTITSGNKEVKMTETRAITQFVQDRTGLGLGTDLIWGAGIDKSLGDDIRITIVATGFGVDSIPMIRDRYAEVVGHDLKREAQVGGRGEGCSEVQNVPPKRETISLIDLDSQTAKSAKAKERDGGGAGDGEFAVVTHQEAEVAARGEHDEPRRIIEAPLPQQPVPPVPPIQQPTFQQSQSGEVAPAVGDEEVAVAEMPSVGAERETTAVVEVAVVEEAVPEQSDKQQDKGDAMFAITELSDDELENIPAYIRRRMKIEAETLPAGSKVSRETLKNDSAGWKKDGGHLFD